jgi:hypothetical protein
MSTSFGNMGLDIIFFFFLIVCEFEGVGYLVVFNWVTCCVKQVMWGFGIVQQLVLEFYRHCCNFFLHLLLSHMHFNWVCKHCFSLLPLLLLSMKFPQHVFKLLLICCCELALFYDFLQITFVNKKWGWWMSS